MHLELLVCTLHVLIFFYQRIHKSNIRKNIIDISHFQNGLNLTGYYLKRKVIEGSHKGKK